jgi:CRISPR-associated endoribonuclease Cas6
MKIREPKKGNGERFMPQILRFILEGEPPQHSFQHATGLRALVLDWVRQADPALSQVIHDANQSKPFRISPLWSEEGKVWFDVAVLAEEVVAPLLEGLRLAGRAIRLGRQTFHIRELTRVAESGWQDLLAPPDHPPRVFTFRLYSPTAHHAPGEFRKSVVLPSPELYFGSWLGRWNLCCPVKFDDTALKSLVEQQVAVTECEGGTRAVRLDQGRTFIGFQGTVRFTLLKPDTIAPELRTALIALARFASFCGTGVDTMRGMGQTDLLMR